MAAQGSLQLLQPEHFSGVVALQRACFPAPFPEELLWQPNHLENHLRVFPEGQFVYLLDGEVVGSASSLRISRDTWQAHKPWVDTTGGLDLSAHEADGEVLFGADISVHPKHQGKGFGRALYHARFNLVRRLGLAFYGTVCRMPDYAFWNQKAGLTPVEYADLVVQGQVPDRTMTPLLKMGLSFERVIPNHMEDEESGNAAAALVWRP